MRDYLQSILASIGKTRRSVDLAKSAVVFAPHPDDEVLACGGTIIKKRRKGSEIWIIYMTDGSLSHRHLMSPQRLAAIRRHEAACASHALGVEPDKTVFLEIPDGQLLLQYKIAIKRVSEILSRLDIDEIYIPYRKETTPDHIATHKIVRDALNNKGTPSISVYEYPIWFWTHWPWAVLPLGGRREVPKAIKRTISSSISLVRDFKHVVDITDVLEIKHQALKEYRSQMFRLVENPKWLTLGDVANGDLLRCFFQANEIFCEQ